MLYYHLLPTDLMFQPRMSQPYLLHYFEQELEVEEPEAKAPKMENGGGGGEEEGEGGEEEEEQDPSAGVTFVKIHAPWPVLR